MTPFRHLQELLGLRFPDETEAAFAADYHARTINTTRLALALGIALYALSGILDAVVMPASTHAIWIIRFAIVCPVLLNGLLLTYLPSIAKYMQLVVFAAVVAAGLGIVG